MRPLPTDPRYKNIKPVIRLNKDRSPFPLHNKPQDYKDLDVFNIRPLNKIRRKIREGVKEVLSEPNIIETALDKIKENA